MNVRDQTFEVMRRLGMTRIFGNPGSTEIPFLTNLPPDLEFVLALHEGSVVGMAAGYALATGRPAFVNLHTAPGLGNAVNALANARTGRAPLVVVVGQQARRHLADEPFLTGRELERMAGVYPVASELPVRAQDVPGAIARAYHQAETGRGPVLVVVPMDDWFEEADPLAAVAPERVVRAEAPADVGDLAELVAAARNPAIVVGAGSATDAGWAALIELAEKLRAPVWLEPFCSRAGFPEAHPQFAGHLPWMRQRLHDTLAPHDLILTVGTSAFRTYLFDAAVPLLEPDTIVAVISDDPAEAHRSRARLAVLGPVAPSCHALAAGLADRSDAEPPEPMRRPAPPAPPGPGEPLRAAHVLAAVAEYLPREVILVEEAPSSRPELLERIATRSPLGFVSTANGSLGFGLSGAIGLRMGLGDRPVVAVLGDGSALYGIHGLWSAAHYGIGVLFIVIGNGTYAVMDAQARARGASHPWPAFTGVDIAGIARSLRCPAVRIHSYEELTATLADALGTLAGRREPLLVEAVVAPDR
ncbi:MAG TPA: thiamine pyrophosphate-binding protein [Solirubrobacteraceae bacterium]|nr:thiamine pyrophosphate-binding protein [Solirubrobacteraceae bacterium]